jgi:hypothetical protein
VSSRALDCTSGTCYGTVILVAESSSQLQERYMLRLRMNMMIDRTTGGTLILPEPKINGLFAPGDKVLYDDSGGIKQLSNGSAIITDEQLAEKAFTAGIAYLKNTCATKLLGLGSWSEGECQKYQKGELNKLGSWINTKADELGHLMHRHIPQGQAWRPEQEQAYINARAEWFRSTIKSDSKFW